jgi:hypothetical protein
VLDDLEVMSRHYGLINRLSRGASHVLSDPDKSTIGEALGVSLAEYDILGGHEYLAEYPQETIADLDSLWFSEKSTKIRSGFYVRAVQKGERKLILINAFHPDQLAHFTDPTHRIVLMLLHSNTDWATLRNNMIGATFPEKADPESIRGTLHARPHDFGFETVTIANNAVHLSAGPFEGAFEIANFFGKVMSLDIRQQPPLILRRMLEYGIDIERTLGVLDNPAVTIVGKQSDLFTETEDMNTEDALAFWRDHCSDGLPKEGGRS